MTIDIYKHQLTERLAHTLWPGCTVRIGMTPLVDIDGVSSIADLEDGPPVFVWNHPVVRDFGPSVVTTITVSHPESTIGLRYKYDPDMRQADIMARGLYNASNRDIQKVLPVIERLRAGRDMTKPMISDYDQAFKRIEAGEDWATVKKELLTYTGSSTDGFNQAMLRRRREKETEKNAIG